MSRPIGQRCPLGAPDGHPTVTQGGVRSGLAPEVPLPLLSPLLLCHHHRPFFVDATTMGVSEQGLDALDWARVFAEMTALEAGAESNVDERRQVGHYWLRAPARAPSEGQCRAITETIDAVRRFALQVSDGSVSAPTGRFTTVLHVGIGGSALGPRFVVGALADGQGLPVQFLDNTDPDGIARILDRLGDSLHHALVVVVSKSGGTPETTNGAALVAARLTALGCDPARHLVAITQEGSALDQRAVAEGWLARFPMWDWVGGRTSVTSAVGLLPAALAGIDIDGFLAGARDMDAWTRSTEWRTNPAALTAGMWFCIGNGQGDRSMVVLPYSDRLELLSRYLQQVVMESVGKRKDLTGAVVHQGLTVYGNKGSTDQHAFVQQLRDGRNDFFVQFVSVLSDGNGDPRPLEGDANAGDFLQGFLLGTRRALHEEGRPSMVLTVPDVSAFTLGAIVALYERAVGLYGSLLGINAYDQPGVEAGKHAAKAMLSLGERLRGLLSDAPSGAESAAATLEADANDVFHLLERMAATGRVDRKGAGATATYKSVG